MKPPLRWPILFVLLLAACQPVNAETPTTSVPNPAMTSLTIAEPQFHKYNRDEWLPSGWADPDNDCWDTRAEVLMQESTAPPLINTKTCRVVKGSWADEFSGFSATEAKDVQIDHLVALGDANRSGGWAWSQDKKIDFANDVSDPDHLNAMQGAENQRKSDKGPDGWTPPNLASKCRYVKAYARIKTRWELTVTQSQWNAINEGLKVC